MLAVLLLPLGVQADLIKLSRSKICHDESSPNYDQIKKYTSFDSLEKCIEGGGRLAKGHNQSKKSSSKFSTKYDRDKFDHWSDDDGNCINTRHELLMKQSTSTVDVGSNKCTAVRGRWLDPYTGKTFYNARDLDIDHLVPLKWAWDHGADKWDNEKRKQLANDEANLFAVQASVNREKGALGPLDWLPPDTAFHCQYVTRFKRIVIKYKLELSSNESIAMDDLFKKVCKR